MKSRILIRMELAEGHWSLGEHDEALHCLRRAIDIEPDEPGLGELVERLLSEAKQGAANPEVASALAGLRDRLHAASPQPAKTGFAVATPTMAVLLDQQGHREHALGVAEEVLARTPGDARALAVRNRLRADPPPGDRELLVLERWLHYFRRSSRREVRT